MKRGGAHADTVSREQNVRFPEKRAKNSTRNLFMGEIEKFAEIPECPVPPPEFKNENKYMKRRSARTEIRAEISREPRIPYLPGSNFEKQPRYSMNHRNRRAGSIQLSPQR